ncbi:hypothetical protein C8R42DRAFT_671258 [Lentinula raphanica]|nr:hypothetical protein C8R42DRAFT_671258 [Lentinula raphanica]
MVYVTERRKQHVFLFWLYKGSKQRLCFIQVRITEINGRYDLDSALVWREIAAVEVSKEC